MRHSREAQERNGYEIRTDLLVVAVDILEARTQRRVANETLKKAADRQGVEPYSIDEVLDFARRLNDFVSARR